MTCFLVEPSDELMQNHRCLKIEFSMEALGHHQMMYYSNDRNPTDDDGDDDDDDDDDDEHLIPGLSLNVFSNICKLLN